MTMCMGPRVPLLGKFSGLSLLAMLVLAFVIGTVCRAGSRRARCARPSG